LHYANAHCFVAAIFERRAVVLGAHLGVAHILQEHQTVRRVLYDDVVELAGTREPAHHAHGYLECLAPVRWRLAKLAGGNLDILLDQRVDHIGGCQIAGSQLNRIQPQAHGILAFSEDHHIAHAGHALQSILYIDVQIVRDELLGIAPIQRKEARAEDKVAPRLGDRNAR
jgi:hypothetical protein